MIRRLFSRDWILTTVLVVIGAAVCARLGIWQLDRLDQRRAFNAHVESMWSAEPVMIIGRSSENLLEMEYRAICAQGEYDFDRQVALRNQFWNDQYGYHLLTPLILADGSAIVVDRGWIPADGNQDPDDWRQYDEDAPGQVCGIIRPGRAEPDVGGRPDPTLSPGEVGLDFWNNVNLDRIGEQLPYPIEAVYLQLDIDEDDVTPPIPYQPELELSEGPHLGYAGQWFIFSALLLFGYPFFVRGRERGHD